MKKLCKLPKKSLKKPNTPEYAQVLVVTWAKPNSVSALLSPTPLPLGLAHSVYPSFFFTDLVYPGLHGHAVHCVYCIDCAAAALQHTV